MSQPPVPRSSDRGDITVNAPVMGTIVVIGHNNQVQVQLQVRGAANRTLQLDPGHPLLQSMLQTLTAGTTQANALSAAGISPTIAPPCVRADDLRPDTPFASPLGVPPALSWDADQLARNFSAVQGLLQHLDRQLGGAVTRLADGQRQVTLSELLVQQGNLALWRFRQGALRLFAEQASLYALAVPQPSAQPALQAFQAAARGNLEVLRGWVLVQHYQGRQPALLDQTAWTALSQGGWREVLARWVSARRLSSEEAQAERQYLSAVGDRYDSQAVQMAAREAEWYYSETLRRQPGQSAALVNLAALLAESALLAYIETGTADRARLYQARSLFQQAETRLSQRPDRDGQVALAQCLLYEATSLPPEAQLDLVPWAAFQTQQLRAALSRDTSGAVRLDLVQRNLARRDPSFLDRQKLERARDLLIGAGAMAGLVALAEQWLSAHAQVIEVLQAGMKAGAGQPPPGPVPGGHPGPQAGLPGLPHTPPAPAGGGLASHGAAAAHVVGKAAAQGVQHKLLATVHGKILAALLATTVVATSATLAAFALTHRATPPAGQITVVRQLASGSQPMDIARGPDGNLWFTETGGNKIGRITPQGALTEFPTPTPTSWPVGITAGPDGNLWFTETAAGVDQVGRITPQGGITEFPLPLNAGGDTGITVGPDGNLWLIAPNINQEVGRITPTGVFTEFPIPSLSYPAKITAGPDGNLWFTEEQRHQIGRITPQGALTEFPTPTSQSFPFGITRGPDGNLWFTEGAGKIGRITPTGAITEFPLPALCGGVSCQPKEIVAGPDGNLWFTEFAGKIGRITPQGAITEYPLPTVAYRTPEPVGIIVGPDGYLWFTASGASWIGRITP